MIIKGSLDIEEFSDFIKKFAPGFTHEDIVEVFNKIDLDGNKNISFVEFEDVLMKGVTGYNTSRTKAKKTLEYLKHIIKSNNL
jgi:Ca2+-binding EF-hand superfamily protein